MRGKAVFYPIGWDDNGLPTERRVQNYYGIRCDPALPYDPALSYELHGEPPGKASGTPVPVSRRNFVELCLALTGRDEQAYAGAWRRLGLSVDWSTEYQTVSDRCRAVAQRGFLRNLARGEAYLAEAPSLWDVTFGTAVAQAELEDRPVAGAYHRVAFRLANDGAGNGTAGEVVVATTRPELLPACVALVAHPDDGRYAPLIGRTAVTPLFGTAVPVLAHHLAEPGKGTGLVMVCTFGDTTDVTWWRDLQLPTRATLDRSGRMAAQPPAGLDDPAGRAAYQQLAGLTVTAARARVAELLRDAGLARGEPEPVTHAVKFYENGSKPLEIMTTRQWYIRNGGRDQDLRDAMLARGRELDWHPPHMRARYENWVGGLSGDWLISRQRFFGVPIPVWYPLDDDGEPRYDAPIPAPQDALPVDPAAEPPPGYDADQRGKPGGFTGDPDVMDTWATSSLTPQIAAGWGSEDDITDRVFPMDLRPQAHEIIRTWLFYTVLRSHAEFGVLPWRHAAISGWILDPDRKKMSKSKGNAVTPLDLLAQYGSDAVRYWAASARLGSDTAFDPAQLRVGRRLAVKLLNVSKLVLAALPLPAGLDRDADPQGMVTEPLDRALLARLAGLASATAAALDGYEHARALELAEEFFWFFCDDYVELVKARAYGSRGDGPAASAVATLRLALHALVRLFAPFLPFVTEEVWSWWQEGSVHRAAWPAAAEFGAAMPTDVRPHPEVVLWAASGAIGAVRAAKSAAKLSMRAPARELVITAEPENLAAARAVLADVLAAGQLDRAELRDGTPAEGPNAVDYQVVL
jgi:valyl-tRNA synthetase